jgi:hypothetical protein
MPVRFGGADGGIDATFVIIGKVSNRVSQASAIFRERCVEIKCAGFCVGARLRLGAQKAPTSVSDP